jgi:hypothetical protein
MPNLALKMFYFFKYMKKNNKNIFRRYTIKVSIHYPDKLVAYLILIIRKVLTVELLMKNQNLA